MSFDPEFLEAQLVELIRRAATDLPRDVEQAIARARDGERQMSAARNALDMLLINIGKAREKSAPMCQDTGMNLWFVRYPAGPHEKALHDAIERATVAATKKSYLRPNTVDSLTGANDGTNIGGGAPQIHFHQWDKPFIKADLLLKGGGCENTNAQYSLPDTRLGAGRDLEGVRKCVLDSVVQAQGKGCGPGILGVCVGGDRGTGYIAAKEALFRELDDVNEDPRLAKLEKQILKEANTLGIGPMGFGGATTLLGVKLTHRNRVPASFFVSIAYMCWAFRRNGFVLTEGGRVSRWLYPS